MCGSIRWSDNWNPPPHWVLNQLGNETKEFAEGEPKYPVFLIRSRLMDIDHICRQIDFIIPNPRKRHSPIQSHKTSPSWQHRKAEENLGSLWAAFFPEAGERKKLSYTCPISPSKCPKRLNHSSPLGEVNKRVERSYKFYNEWSFLHRAGNIRKGK